MSEHPSNRDSNLIDLFTYRPPNADQVEQYERLRQSARRFAYEIIMQCPPCADRSAAIRKVREAIMTANAAIALDSPAPGYPRAPAAEPELDGDGRDSAAPPPGPFEG